MTKKRFYIDTLGNDDEAYRFAMEYACNLAEDDPEIERVIILIHTKRNTGWFERLFGRETVKKLFAGTHFKNCRPLFRFETKKTYYDYYDPSEVVITCGLDSDDIFKVDDFTSVKAIIAIPWLKERTEKWIRTWNPTEIRGKQDSIKPFPEPSCVVKKAMQELTNSINMSTGINSPFDEEQAKTYILALHKYEPNLDENIIKAYLVRDLGWEAEYANDVALLIMTLNSGRHFKGGKHTGLQYYYKSWKEQCKNKNTNV